MLGVALAFALDVAEETPGDCARDSPERIIIVPFAPARPGPGCGVRSLPGRGFLRCELLDLALQFFDLALLGINQQLQLLNLRFQQRVLEPDMR